MVAGYGYMNFRRDVQDDIKESLKWHNPKFTIDYHTKEQLTEVKEYFKDTAISFELTLKLDEVESGLKEETKKIFLDVISTNRNIIKATVKTEDTQHADYTHHVSDIVMRSYTQANKLKDFLLNNLKKIAKDPSAIHEKDWKKIFKREGAIKQLLLEYNDKIREEYTDYTRKLKEYVCNKDSSNLKPLPKIMDITKVFQLIEENKNRLQDKNKDNPNSFVTKYTKPENEKIGKEEVFEIT
jgi:hypothetical protein